MGKMADSGLHNEQFHRVVESLSLTKFEPPQAAKSRLRSQSIPTRLEIALT